MVIFYFNANVGFYSVRDIKTEYLGVPDIFFVVFFCRNE